MGLDRSLCVGGLCSCALGSIFALVAVFKGKEARSLQGITYVENLSEIKHLLSAIPLLIAITGRVWAPTPLKCALSEGEGAIVELREDQKSQTRNATVWMSNSEPLREVVRETDWALTDASGHVHLPVLDGRRATGDYLQMSGDVFIPAEEGLLEQVLGQLAGHKSLGVRRSERVLAQGAVITAIGELATAMDHPGMFKGAFRAPGKVFVLQAPRKGPFMLSRRRLPEIVASAQATSIYCTQMATFFTVAGATMLLAVGVRKVWLWHREQTMKRRVDEARRRRRTTAGGGGRSTSSTGAGMEVGHEEDREGDQGGDARSGTCVVCLERESELVYPQCGHLCVCSLCGGAGPGLGRCPICRSRGPPIKVFRT